MGLYTNCKCDVCGKLFADDDDVVICPVCGTPQHRACYQARGACVHEDLHVSGYEWKRPAPEKENPPQGSGTVSCKRCGAQNPAGAVRCQICGAPFTQNEQTFQGETASQQNSTDAGASGRTSYTRSGPGFLPDFEVDGVTAREMADYLGPASAAVFIPKFNVLLQQRGSIAAWNIPALILGPFYYFYRRMNKIGLILLAILAVIYVPGTIYSLEYFKAFYAPEYFNLTLPYSQWILDVFAPIAAAASYLRIALHIYCCVQANTFFLDRVIADVKDMQTRFSQNDRGENYRTALSYRGRPATMAAVLAILGFFGILYAVLCMQLFPLLAG